MNENNVQTDRANFALTVVTETLENVLRFLPALELLRVQTVCKAWQKSSINVLNRRKGSIQYSTLVKTWESDELGYVTIRPKKRRRTNISFNGWNKGDDCRKEFCTIREKWSVLPTFILGNCVDMYWRLPSYRQRQTTKEIGTKLHSMLPSNCELLLLGTMDGLVCSDATKSSLENDVQDIRIFTNICSIPVVEHDSRLHIHALATLSRFDKNIFLTNFKTALTKPDLKMVLVFHRPKACIINMCNSELQSAINRNVVVVGCVVDDPIVYFKKSTDIDANNNLLKRKTKIQTSNVTQELVAMAFEGKNMKAASVLVGPQVRTVDCLKCELKKLRHSVRKFYDDCLLCNNSNKSGKNKCENSYIDPLKPCTHTDRKLYGFMIACCSRADGTIWYDEDSEKEPTINVEQKAFREIFPNVPLFGLHGIGEVGANINIVSESDYPGTSSDKYYDLGVSGTTIFGVLLY